jgi:hypothetical protein
MARRQLFLHYADVKSGIFVVSLVKDRLRPLSSAFNTVLGTRPCHAARAHHLPFPICPTSLASGFRPDARTFSVFRLSGNPSGIKAGAKSPIAKYRPPPVSTLYAQRIEQSKSNGVLGGTGYALATKPGETCSRNVSTLKGRGKAFHYPARCSGPRFEWPVRNGAGSIRTLIRIDTTLLSFTY